MTTPTPDPTTRVTAEVTTMEHQVDLRITGAPDMTIGPNTVTPVGVRIAYEDDEVVMVRIDGREPSWFVDYYPLNNPADWPAWLAALVEEHRPADRAAIRSAAHAEAAAAVMARIETCDVELARIGLGVAHFLLCNMPTAKEN